MKEFKNQNPSIWNYEIINAFNNIYYQNMLTKKDVIGTEKVVKEVTIFKDGVDGSMVEEPVLLNGYYFIFQKNMIRYLLESSKINLLPIQVKEYTKIGYNKEGYLLIKKLSPKGFRSEKIFNFREIIDNFAFFNHTNPAHFKLWKIIAFASYMNRMNIRISSEPAFGKDGVIRLIDDLLEHVGVIQKPTLAKLEYLTNNKLIMVNEFINLNPQETREMEQYLLTTGDFSNKYEKRSRARSEFGGTEEYDISRLSLILAFNNKDCYPQDVKYFDDIHTKQIKERFLPIKFGGKLSFNFERQLNPVQIATDNRDFFVCMCRSINYYCDENNVRKELKAFPSIEFDFKDRWKINFDTICKFINLYANDEKEYKKLVGTLYNCHIDYMEMVNTKSNDLLRDWYQKVDVDDTEEVDIEKITETVGDE